MLTFGLAKLAISIARKMNALIFLVPEDIVDIRPRLVSSQNFLCKHKWLTNFLDSDFRRKFDEHRTVKRQRQPECAHVYESNIHFVIHTIHLVGVQFIINRCTIPEGFLLIEMAYLTQIIDPIE